MSTGYPGDYLPGLMSKLFSRDLDLPLQTIFLSLDPVSLKRSRQVCQQWSEFIKKRVWRGEKGSQPYLKMREKLEHQWRRATPAARSMEMDGEINTVSCDDSILVVGMKDGMAKVYTIDSTILLGFNFVQDLDCNPTPSFVGGIMSKIASTKQVGEVQSDIGKDIVATITDKGDVSVWMRNGWGNLYKQSHHGGQEVYAVKVLPSIIITGGCDGRLAILSWNGAECNFVRMLGEDPPKIMPKFETPMKNPWHITHLDSDGEVVLVAHSMCLKVWSLQTNALVNTIDTDWTNSLALSYPFGVIAQNEKRLKVLNLMTGEVVRRVPSSLFWQVAHNSSYLVGSTPNFPHQTSNRVSVTVHSFKDILGQGKEADVWKRVKYLRSGDQMPSSYVNTTCLVTAQGSMVNLWDFWNCDDYDRLDTWTHQTC